MPACWIGTVHPTSFVNRVLSIARPVLFHITHLKIMDLDRGLLVTRRLAALALSACELTMTEMVRNGSSLCENSCHAMIPLLNRRGI